MGRRRKKRYVAQLPIEKYAAEGKSIGYLDGKVIFVRGAIPGDVVDVRLQKVKKDYAEGQVNELVKPSLERIPARCDHFGSCGGCQWQMLEYGTQLEYKESQVREQMRHILRDAAIDMRPILSSPKIWQYRNKVEFSFSNKQYIPTDLLGDDSMTMDKSVLGFHARGFFDKVVEIQQCHIQPSKGNSIRQFLRTVCEQHHMPYYDMTANEGFLRNVVIRETLEGNTLVNLIVHSGYDDYLDTLLENLTTFEPKIDSIYYTINDKLNDSIHDLEPVHHAGERYVQEQLGDFVFNISPKSFFQTNSIQANLLYEQSKNLLDLQGDEVIYDIYCGTGSIGIYMSTDSEKIIGVELIEDAVHDARENAKINQVQDKCTFYVGDVTTVCDEKFFRDNPKPDVIIVDPPRAGLSDALIQQLLNISVDKLLYISCNPATQARDLMKLSEIYRTQVMQPVDLFPHTHHIENIALLRLKN